MLIFFFFKNEIFRVLIVFNFNYIYLQPGCPVMAIFAQDEALYRAEIVEVKGNRNYLVQYVDFGNKATVEQRRMYPVEKRFMIIPKQGVRCSLKNIFPINGGNWTTQNSQEIEQYLYEEGEFECTYHEEKDKKYLISLSHNKIDVANSLVEKKYAMFATSSAPKSIGKNIKYFEIYFKIIKLSKF